jgi:N-acetylmuramoyl-L-alanine amidase
MIRNCLIASLVLFSSLAPALQAAAPAWQESKIGNLSYVTFDSFCDFYEFNKSPVPEQDAFTIKSVYGSLTLKANSREGFYNGRRIWLSFPFVRDDKGNAFVSRLDVIKTFDPLLRRSEMAPRKPVQGVVIDAGHGGTDNGTRSRANYFEKVATLDTAKRLEAILKAQGIPTFMTRTDDVFITLEERCDIANDHKNWIFVSLHYNEAGSSANGVETYCLTPQYSSSTADGGSLKVGDREQQPGNKNDTLNVLLADYVHAEITKLHSNDGDRGVKRARFVVLRGTEIPAILVEGGFLSNSVDARLITSGAYRQKLAESISRGIKNYMTLMNSPVGKAPTVIKPVDKDKPKFREPTVTPAAPVPSPAPKPAPPPAKPETPAPVAPTPVPEKKPEPVAPPQPAVSTTTPSSPARVPVVPNLNEVTRPAPDSGTSAAPAPSGTAAPEPHPSPAEPPKHDAAPPANEPSAPPQSSGTAADAPHTAPDTSQSGTEHPK